MVYGIMFISLLLYIPTDKGICNFHFLNEWPIKWRLSHLQNHLTIIDDSF